LKSIALCSIPLLGWAAFATAYFGSVIPNAIPAKEAIVATGDEPAGWHSSLLAPESLRALAGWSLMPLHELVNTPPGLPLSQSVVALAIAVGLFIITAWEMKRRRLHNAFWVVPLFLAAYPLLYY